MVQPDRHGHTVPFDIQNLPSPVQGIAGECERLWEGALHSSHNQFAAAKIWRATDRWLSILAATIGAVAGVSAVTDLIGARLAELGALIAAVISGAANLLAPQQHAAKGVESGNAYVRVRDSARQMLCVDLETTPFDESRRQLDTLTTGLHATNDAAEPVSFMARSYARRTHPAVGPVPCCPGRVPGATPRIPDRPRRPTAGLAHRIRRPAGGLAHGRVVDRHLADEGPPGSGTETFTRLLSQSAAGGRSVRRYILAMAAH